MTLSTLPESTGIAPSTAQRPKVKICGVTSPEEARLAADLGADFVGLNFYPPSPRFVETERAAEIAAAVLDRVQTVGVFVNRPTSEVADIAGRVGLDLLQFHGDETAADIRLFAHRALKAFRVRDRIDEATLSGFEAVWGILIDARHPQLYGGTGESWQFDSLRELDHSLARRAFIAGGLEPGNVAAAISAAKPFGIDLCSGLESSPGKKDPELLRRLFEEINNGETPTAA